MKRRAGFLYVFLMVIFFISAAYTQMGNMDMGEGHGSFRDDIMMDAILMDRHFIERMIPHHLDAVEMAKLALEKSEKAEIKKLANDIIRTQNVEIENMKKWYREWFSVDVPSRPVRRTAKGKGMRGINQGMQIMDMSMSHDMMGGTPDDLKKAPDFDKEFLIMMVRHHKTAIPMSGMIIDSKKPEMRKLATDIITAQSGEIQMMIKWYQSWYGSW